MWRVRWRVCLWTCLVLAGAVCVGRVVQVLSIDGGSVGVEASFISQQLDHQQHFNGTLGTQEDQLVWFLQISDLHLSRWHDAVRTAQFRDFCQRTVPAMAPHVVLASGDLTDAKSKDGMGSQQYEKEWNKYRVILQETGLYNTTVWLDVRGNHDNFNLPSLKSDSNLFASHSVQGRYHQRSYLHSLRLPGISVAFIAIDATLLPGPKRPFNFVGVLPPSEFSLLQGLAQEARDTHDHTFWFGHYPTSCIIGPTHGVDGVRAVMHGGVAYVCGHLHSLGGLVPAMHTRQHNGLLELELEDWKDGRMFRVMALDHGLFSFVDVRYNTWPVMLITNPKHALYHQPTRENPELTQRSSHIRVLVWSLANVTRVVVKINDEDTWRETQHIKGPLYVAPWTPSVYSAGLHTIQVLAVDDDGRERIVRQPFSLDGSSPSFRLLPRVFLMSNISAVFQFLFGCSVFVCTFVLCVFRYLHYTLSRSRRSNICRGGVFRFPFIRAFVRKLWVLSSVDRIFWPLIIYMLYLPIGPWLIGELLDNRYGVIFSWGTFVYGSFLPGSLTFAYGFALYVVFFFPFILALAHCVDCRMHSIFIEPCTGVLHHACKNLPLMLPLMMQVFQSYLMYLAYGWLCVLFAPIRSWAVVFGVVMWIQAEMLPAGELHSAAELWYGEQRIAVAPSNRRAQYQDNGGLNAWLRTSGAVDGASSNGGVASKSNNRAAVSNTEAAERASTSDNCCNDAKKVYENLMRSEEGSISEEFSSDVVGRQQSASSHGSPL